MFQQLGALNAGRDLFSFEKNITTGCRHLLANFIGDYFKEWTVELNIESVLTHF